MTITTVAEGQIILEIIARISHRAVETLESTDVLTDLDIDSLAFIMLILEVEQSLGRTLFDMESIGQLRTVGDMLELVRQ